MNINEIDFQNLQHLASSDDPVEIRKANGVLVCGESVEIGASLIAIECSYTSSFINGKARSLAQERCEQSPQ